MKEKGGNFRPLAQENRKQIEGEKEKRQWLNQAMARAEKRANYRGKCLCLVV